MTETEAGLWQMVILFGLLTLACVVAGVVERVQRRREEVDDER